ncbi:MAG: FliA/WhiG family RNA polymerase sigma factor [Acidobacteriota bacterium]|jgi:RNA polymerase sigma factor for flagellar operon FliA|nr:FliA/WhiG family RNA polymerase sigma factor [Acidobacteriota bacterium]
MIYDLEHRHKPAMPPPVMTADMEREGLILEHMSQIKYIAQRISTKLPAHVELNDLIGTGVLGLLDAIEKFDPNRGVKFKTYAELRIKGAILDSLRNLDWAPRSLRKKSKDLEKICHDLEQRLGRPASDKEICEEIGLSLEEFYELVDQLKGLNLGSFQELVGHDVEKTSDPLMTYIPDTPQMDPFFLFQKSEVKGILASAIEMLPKKERLVISLYYFDELTMKEIGKVLGVNESRVSQLHTKAMLRLRSKLRKMNDQDKSINYGKSSFAR